jgi:microcystin-dependent protein
MFAGNFAPRGWAFCDGQLIAISQNDALFSLLGTIYGGDGRTTFGLPDMRGRIPIHAGSGPGLSSRRLGAKAGSESVTLTTQQLASHNHDFEAVTELGDKNTAANNTVATVSAGNPYRTPSTSPALPFVQMADSAIKPTGGSRSHTNLMPTLCVHFIIALFGIYPSRN